MFQKAEPQRVSIPEHFELLAMFTYTHGFGVNDLITAFAQFEGLVFDWPANLACFSVDFGFSPDFVGSSGPHLGSSKSKETIFYVYHF